MSSTRQVIGAVFGGLSRLLSSATSATEALTFAKLYSNELDEGLFPWIAGFAMGACTTNIIAAWLKNPSHSATDVAANAWQTSKSAGAATIGLAVFNKGSQIGAANLFAWATVVALIQVAAEHGYKQGKKQMQKDLKKQLSDSEALDVGAVGKLTKEEFTAALESAQLTKLELATMAAGYIKSAALVGFLTHAPMVGQGLQDAKNKEISSVDQALVMTIATAAAEQALADFGSVIAEAYSAVKHYCQVRATMETPVAGMSEEFDEEAQYEPLDGGRPVSPATPPVVSPSARTNESERFLGGIAMSPARTLSTFAPASPTADPFKEQPTKAPTPSSPKSK